MALYKTALRMAHDTTWSNRRKWSTTFYLEAASSAAAAAAMVGAWSLTLRNATDASVFAYEVYATDLVPGTSDYTVQPIVQSQQRGVRASPGGEKYLLKACIAVTLAVPNSRPSRKFWRMGLHEADVFNGVVVDPAVAALVQSWFNELVSELAITILDPDGQPVTGVQKTYLTTREFGRYAGNEVPDPPPVG